MTRPRALAVAMVLALLALLVALPGPCWPVLPRHMEVIAPAGMTAVFGQAGPAADGSLFVTGTQRDTALQVRGGLRVDSNRYTVLRYAARDFPSTLELVLTWRSAQEPLETHTATLPSPGTGVRSFDLASLPAWRGTIIELGLGEFPVPHQVQEDRGFKQFHWETLRLESPSLAGGLALMADTLTAPRPWTQSSINSLGRELRSGDPSRPALALVLALAVFVATWLLLGRRRGEHVGRLLTPVAIAVLVIWLVLDMAWQRQLAAQNRLTRAAAADGAHVDAGLIEVADRLRRWLHDYRPGRKLLLLATTPYAAYRLSYLLLPEDVAAGTGVLVPDSRRPPAGTVLAVYAPFLPTRSGIELRWPDLGIAELDELDQIGPLRLYEYGGEVPP